MEPDSKKAKFVADWVIGTEYIGPTDSEYREYTVSIAGPLPRLESSECTSPLDLIVPCVELDLDLEVAALDRVVTRIDSPPKSVSMTGPVVDSEPELVVPAKAVSPDKTQPKDARTAMVSKAGSRNVRRSLKLAATSEGKDDGGDGEDPKTLVKISETTVPLRLTKEPRPVAPAKDVLSLASTVQPAQDDGTSSLEAGVTVAAANRPGVTTDKAAATVALPAAVLAKKEARREWAIAMGKRSAGKVRDSTHRPEDQALRTCHLCNQQKSGHMRRHLRLGHRLCNDEIDELLVQWKQMAAGPGKEVANEKALTCPYCRQPHTWTAC